MLTTAVLAVLDHYRADLPSAPHAEGSITIPPGRRRLARTRALEFPRMDDHVELLREAGRSALEISMRLQDMVTDDLIDSAGDAGLTAISIVQDAAQEIRRQALWLLGEADIREKHPT